MKIRGNTVGTTIEPKKAVLKCDGLTEEEKTKARKNIGAASIDDAISPTIGVSAISNGHRLTITDVNRTTTFDVLNGEDGHSPYIGENGNWWAWDAAAGAWTDTQVAADTDAGIRQNLVALANMTVATETLDISAYEKGSINESGDSTYRTGSRARTIGIHTADYDTTIYSANGVEGICAYFFDDDGNTKSVTSWCATLKIPAGSRYRLILSLDPKAANSVVNELSEILANFYFVNEYKIVKQVEELSYRVAETENEVDVLWEKVGGVATEKTMYVALDGDDSFVDTVGGTADAPLATFNEAIRRGATTIIAEPGVYRQTIYAHGLDKLTIRPDRSHDGSQGTDKIILHNTSDGGSLDDYDVDSSMFQCAYTANPDSRMYKVFVSQELPIVDEDNSDDVEGIYCYNVNAYIYGDAFSDKVDDGSNAIKLRPVLTIEECEADNNTFCYHAEGNSIIVHCAKYQYNQFLYIPTDEEVIASFENCGKLVLEDVRTEYGYAHGISIQNCRDVTLIGCEANLSTNGEGFYLNHTNAKLSGCKATNNFGHGFRIHENCHAELTDCYARGASLGDGANFGQGCRGAVMGGEYSNMGGCGISINAGAEVNVYNAIMRINFHGLGVFGDPANTDAKVIAMNNAIIGNDFTGLIASARTVVGLNRFVGNFEDVATYRDGVYEDLNEW